jgi:serine/threonine protein kinase
MPQTIESNSSVLLVEAHHPASPPPIQVHADPREALHRSLREALLQSGRVKTDERVDFVKSTIFGALFAATHKASGLRVAVKVSLLSRVKMHVTLDNARVQENPVMEAAVMRQLKHPFIVALVDEWEFRDCHFLATEWVAGGELFDIVAAKPLGEAGARRTALQLLAALHSVHESGFAHCDVSLENVLVDANGDAKLMDFGQAIRAPGHKVYEPVPRGKALYASPEVVARQPYDPRKADVFALGVAIFTMATGIPPFKLADMAEPRYRRIVTDPAGLEKLTAQWGCPLSPALCDLLRYMLAAEQFRPTLAEVVRHPWFTAAAAGVAAKA